MTALGFGKLVAALSMYKLLILVNFFVSSDCVVVNCGCIVALDCCGGYCGGHCVRYCDLIIPRLYLLCVA